MDFEEKGVSLHLLHRTTMKRKETNIDKSWKNVLRKMTKGELLLIVYDYENYSPQFIALAEEVLQQQYGMTEEELDSIPEPDQLIEGETGSRSLLLEVLERMGCGKGIGFDSDSSEDDGKCDFSFSYMGESFSASATNDRVYVEIEKFCCGFRLDDKEEVAIVKEAINKVNEKCSAKMYYLIDEEYKLLYVECCLSFLLVPLIPNLELYIYYQLKYINKAKQYLTSVLEELKSSQADCGMDV